MKIVETDNYGGDYPDEEFVNLPHLDKDQAERIAKAINAECCRTNSMPRYWKVVEDDYVLQPGFEP
jgi:hypothetical protein